MKRLILLFIISMAVYGSSAQTRTFDGVKKLDIRNRGYIMENNSLAGYYVFYLKEKVDKKNEAFVLELLDNDLNSVKSIDIIRPKNSVLLENVFNGNTFILMFYDGKDAIELLTYDKKGTKLGSKLYPEIDKKEKMMLKMQLDANQEGGALNTTIFPLGTDGFLRLRTVDNKKIGYTIEAFDNSLKPIWTFASDEKSDLLEMASVMSSGSDYVGVNVMRKKSMMTKKMDMFFNLVDSRTGKALFEIELKDKGAELSLLNCNIDPEANEILLSGEYYAPGDEIANSKSQGLYFTTYDLKGTQANIKKLSWARDLKEVKSDDGGKGSNLSIFFHKLVRTSDGKVYAIGEQYKKAVSALGVASQMMGGGASATSIFVYNMIVLEFDKDYNLVKTHEIPKKKTEVSLPQGAAYASASLLGYMVKWMGGFDYEFTVTKPGSESFYSIYKDYNRKDDSGKKSDTMIGALLVEGGQFKNERFPLNTEGTSLWVSPAKPGYIAVSEYFKKKKTIYMRLEKVSY